MKHLIAICIASGLTLLSGTLAAAEPAMTVYKTKTCGCCGKWVEHLRANGFTVNVQEVEGTEEIRHKFGVPEKLASCHTGVIGGYAASPARGGKHGARR